MAGAAGVAGVQAAWHGRRIERGPVRDRGRRPGSASGNPRGTAIPDGRRDRWVRHAPPRHPDGAPGARGVRRCPRWTALVIALLAALAFGAEPAGAATFTVTTTADEGQLPVVGTACTNTPSGQCSLRAAIQAANAAGGAHRIVLAGGATYRLTVPGRGEDAAVTGDLDVTASVAIVAGPGGATVEAGPNAAGGFDRVFDVRPGGMLGLLGVTVRHGNPGDADGGAIRNVGALAVANGVVHDSTAGSGNGGGIFNGSAGSLAVSDSVVRNNAAGGAGGGIATIGTPGSRGTATIANSTLAGNSACCGAGAFVSYATVSVVNTTIVGNVAGSFVGGFSVDNFGDASLASVTVAGNSSGFVIGGIGAANASPVLRLKNSLVSGNSASAANSDCFGNLTSQGYNLVADPSSCSLAGDTTGNLSGVDPLLGVLGDNGGFTPTRALGSGSPAINAGPPAGCTDPAGAPLARDQRGVGRASGGRCDIGAFEVGSGGPVVALGPEAAGAGLALREDAGISGVPLLLADSDTPAASAAFTVTPLSSNAAVIPPSGVTIGGSGAWRTVSVAPAPDASGGATVTLAVRDAANVETLVAVPVTVAAVNDPPSFAPGGNVTVLEDSGPHSSPWATSIAAGPANEAGQALAFAVASNSNPALFAAGPAIAPDGTLTFTPAPNATGAASVAVRLADDGGTANGGADTSAPASLTITVAPINDPPTVALPGSPPTYALGSPPVVLDASAALADVDSPTLEGGALEVRIASGGRPGDRLEVREQAGPDPIDVQGNSVVVAGVPIGTVSGGAAGEPLALALNGNATPARVQAVLRTVAFMATAQTLQPEARAVEVRASDGDGGVGDVASLVVSVRPAGPPPAPCAARPSAQRPNVRVAATAGGGRLVATIEAPPLDATTNNPLTAVRVTEVRNARVTLNGQPVAAGQTIPIPGAVTATLSVERVAAGQPTHVAFVVVDSCGEWPTFVGGGAAAGF